MSVRVSGLIWRIGPQDRAQRVVLLAIADNANDDGYCLSRSSIPARCSIRKDMLAREMCLRSEIKAEPKRDRQMQLLAEMDQEQKGRFRHEETCPTCQQIESQLAR
jgi:hypothetical protein